MNWTATFTPETSLIEMFVRGTVMYLGLYFMLRFIIKREAGALGITDMLVIVLLADAAQNGMADDYKSIPDGLVLVFTIVAWSYFLDYLAFKFKAMRRILRPSRVQLVDGGRLVRKNLEKERVTEDELMGELRAHGVADLEDVHAAYIESDGMISVIKSNRRRPDPDSNHPSRRNV